MKVLEITVPSINSRIVFLMFLFSSFDFVQFITNHVAIKDCYGRLNNGNSVPYKFQILQVLICLLLETQIEQIFVILKFDGS